MSAIMKKEGVLLLANYANNTGFAWRNILALYGAIGSLMYSKNKKVCVSFAKIIGDPGVVSKGCHPVYFEFDPYNINLHGLYVLRMHIKKYNIRYCYFTDMRPWHWLYALLRVWGVKVIVMHCRVSVSSPKVAVPEKGASRAIKALINQIGFLRVNYIYAISDFVRHRLIYKACYPENRVFTIYDGVDCERFRCNRESMSGDVVRVFCCSRANLYKGVHVLIEAISILKTEYNCNHLIVRYAGDGPDLNVFKELVSDYGLTDEFIFLGELASTHSELCESDIVVVPSMWGEGFGLTVAEGMAASKAVVASDAGAISEVIGQDSCGRLFPPGDAKQLARCLLELSSDEHLRDEMGRKARQRVLEKFSEADNHRNVGERLLRDFKINV